MANEIAVADVRGRKFQLVFLFPVTTPLVDKDAAVIVPTPSAGLPANVLDQLGAPVVTALNDGTAMWERAKFTAPEGMTPGAVLAKVESMYAARRDAVQDEYAAKHQFVQHVGTLHDAPAE